MYIYRILVVLCIFFFSSALNNQASAEVVGDSFQSQAQRGCCCGTGKKTLLITLGGGMSGKSGPDSKFGKELEEAFAANPEAAACISHKALDYGVMVTDYYWGTRTTYVSEMLKKAQKEIDSLLEEGEYCSVQVAGYSGGAFLASWLGSKNPTFRVTTINGAVTPVHEVADQVGSTHFQDAAFSEGRLWFQSDLMEMFFDPKPTFPLASPPGSDGFPMTHYVAEGDWVVPPVCQQTHSANSFVRYHDGGHMDNIQDILGRLLRELPCEECGDHDLDKLAGEECDPPNGAPRWREEGDKVTFFQCTNQCKLKQKTLPRSALHDPRDPSYPGLQRLIENGWVTELDQAPWYQQSVLAPTIEQGPAQAVGGHTGKETSALSSTVSFGAVVGAGF